MDPKLRHVNLNGFALAPGSAVVHFYYNPAERLRLASFLLEGLSYGDGAVLACTRDGYQELRGSLERIGLVGRDSGILRVEVSPVLTGVIQAIGDAVRISNRKHPRVRVLADFDAIVGKESIFELEAALAGALSGLNVVCVTQYDGNSFDASVTIEQFRSHALCIMGNAFYHENRDFTPPDRYYRRRAAGGRK